MTEAERRADQARQLIDNALFREVLRAIEAQAIEEAVKPVRWLPWFRDQKRRAAIERVHVVRAIPAHLTTIIQTAEIEAKRPASVA